MLLRGRVVGARDYKSERGEGRVVLVLDEDALQHGRGSVVEVVGLGECEEGQRVEAPVTVFRVVGGVVVVRVLR